MLQAHLFKIVWGWINVLLKYMLVLLCNCKGNQSKVTLCKNKSILLAILRFFYIILNTAEQEVA